MKEFIFTISVLILGLSCKFPEVSREFQELTILDRIINSSITQPVENTADEQETPILPVFTIQYFGNGNDGGTPPVDATEYTNGQFITVLGNTGSMTNAGNSFVGWNTESDGSGDSYVAGNTIQVDGANIQLFAQWSVLPIFSVIYDGNGNDSGIVPNDGNDYLVGATVTVLGNTGSLTLAGFSFTGWNTAADGSGTAYDPLDTFSMPASNVTLYAQWTALPTFTVTYNGNGSDGGAVPVDTDNYLAGETVTVSDNTGNLTLSGFAFSRWNTAADGSGSSYLPSETFPMPASDVTLYAQWDAAFSVTYSANGATGGASPVDNEFYLESDAVTVLGNPGGLIRDGRAWVGWNTAADGSGTTYTEGTTFSMPASNITLYAMYLEGIIAFPFFDTGANSCFDASDLSPCPVAGFPLQAIETNHAQTLPESLIDNSDGTITDTRSGLLWRKCPVGLSGTDCSTGTAGLFIFNDSQSICQSTYGANWRTPTIKELVTLMSNSTTNSPFVDESFFPSMVGTFYSSTFDGTAAHFISFFGGTFSGNTLLSNTRRVICVNGVNTTDFINLSDMGDGRILDQITGLQWQKCHAGRNNDATCSDNIVEPNTLSWEESLQYCNNLNLSSYTDWRLPNRNELISLSDFSIGGANKFDTSLFSVPGFENTQMWSSNGLRSISGESQILWVNPQFGNLSIEPGSNTNRTARCVRGPD